LKVVLFSVLLSNPFGKTFFCTSGCFALCSIFERLLSSAPGLTGRAERIPATRNPPHSPATAGKDGCFLLTAFLYSFHSVPQLGSTRGKTRKVQGCHSFQRRRPS
jgi:hypothetical protein